MTKVYVLMAFNADGNTMQKNVFGWNESVFDDLADLAEGSLLVMPKQMFEGDPPLTLLKYSGHITTSENTHNLAHIVAKLCGRDAGKALVFCNDEMLSELESQGCEYDLVTIAPKDSNEAFPDEYIDGFEFLRECRTTKDSIYSVKVYKPSLAKMSSSKVQVSIDNIESWLNSDEEEEPEDLDDFLTHIENTRDTRESFTRDTFEGIFDNDDNDDDDDEYEEGGLDKTTMAMLDKAAKQIGECITKINVIEDKVSTIVRRTNSAIEHNNKVSMDTEEYVKRRLNSLDEIIEGLQNQVGNVVEEQQRMVSRGHSGILWVIAILSIILNVINLVL